MTISKPKMADRTTDLTPFKVVNFLEAAARMQAEGRDIIRMETGEPLFDTPAPVQQAAIRSLEEHRTRYTPACGIQPLREAIADQYERTRNLTIDPARIVVTTGSSAALGLLCDLLFNPGDGVLLSDPGYPCNANFLRRAGAEPQFVPVQAENHYQLTGELLDAHWRENTRGTIIASPANPTGEIISRHTLEDLWRIVDRRDGVLLSDEIYHGLSYTEGDCADSDGEVCALEISDDAFVINSFSKYFGMTGWRVGWLVAPHAYLERINIMAQNFYISPPALAQHAALAALRPESIEIFEQRRDIFRERRDFLVPALRDIGFTIPQMPGGAFYVYAGIENFSDDCEAFCWRLLEDVGVSCTPGTDFGHYQANRFVRFSYTEPLVRLEEAVDRLQKALTLAP
ncbi:MAG: aminotransferase class I/II-fold pyridoxal phosphate-dependent enzyme [bacterium]